MPAPAGTKRVKGVSIYRPFVFGSIARPIDPNKRPPGVPDEHTHQWTVWVKGVNDEDISYWLRKVQFKLHETYANALRTVDTPPFSVTETGWGEFEIQIKLHFVPESNEKPQTLWHGLKLHPYGPTAEADRENRAPIISQNYEEVVFNEPVEAFYDVLTGNAVDGTITATGPAAGGGPGARGKNAKGSKQAGSSGAAGRGAAAAAGGAAGAGARKTAEIPDAPSPGNPYSRKTERQELDRMKEALKKVEGMIDKERGVLKEREKTLEALRRSEGVVVKKK
ncbi:MAG: hypothetical protein M1819_006701 [Sarea resinae]|nr:MAG: hypothetical protein M1819_006701 [Sarea resinae]